MIVCEGLTKLFGSVTAIQDFSLEIPDGCIFGLLGPNGAGKTTTINILSTLLNKTSGKAYVSGFDVSREKDSVRKNIGIVFQEPALDERLTGRENLEFHAMMYSVGKAKRNERIKEVLELVELDKKADVLVENYSGGMKRRLEIARGLIQSPNVLFLDEPTLGLDAQTRRHIWNYIKDLNNKQNVTVILTTHYMEEADYLCDRVAIIDNGKIVAIDTPANLKDSLGGDLVIIEFEGDGNMLMKTMEAIDCVKKARIHEGHMYLTVMRAEKRIPEIISASDRIGIKINSVSLKKPSLEDVFLHFTGKVMREEGNNHSKDRRRMHGRR